MDKEKQASSPSDHLNFRHRYPEHWQALQAHHAGFRDPTHVTFYDPKSQTQLQWHSRAHRKGILPRPVKEELQAPLAREKRFPRLFGIDLKDISWHVAFLFTFGSVFWCINGVMIFDFFVVSTTAIANAEAATAFLGGSLFLVGGYLGFVESLNPSRDLEFGYELDKEAHKLRRRSSRPSASLGRSRNHFGKHMSPSAAGSSREKHGSAPRWRWWGSDWHSIGYVANAIQLFGASIFWVSTLCGLPGILPESGATLTSGLSAKSLALWEVFYWVPQVIGAPCFVISGALFMLECSKRWYKPEVFTLGWQIGFWNFIGGWGFWLCGIFGIMRETGGSEKVQQWGTAFSTWWGSWAFLLGSYLQLYETLNK